MMRIRRSALTLSASAIASMLIAGGAQAWANHVPGATYNGSTSAGGSVSFTVTADGSGIVVARFIDPGETCNFTTVIKYYAASREVLPITDHAFSDPTPSFGFQGSFQRAERVRGSFAATADPGGAPSADCGSPLSWNATTNDEVPPETVITRGAPNRTADRNVKFGFRSGEDDSTFECKLDERPFARCSSPRTFRRLDEGEHSFRVRASDPAGNRDTTPARDSFRVVD